MNVRGFQLEVTDKEENPAAATAIQCKIKNNEKLRPTVSLIGICVLNEECI